MFVIGRTARDLTEAQAAVKRDGGKVGLVDFKEKGLSALSVKFAQHRLHQVAAKTATPMRACHGNGEDFPLARHQPRKDETGKRVVARTDLTHGKAEYRILLEKAGKFMCRPWAGKIFGVECRKVANIVFAKCFNHKVGAKKGQFHAPDFRGRAKSP